MPADLGPILKAAYPQVVATLVRVLGDMDRATDVAQDALVKALQRWQVEGVPRQPVAWLVTVGRNRAIDQLRRERRLVSLDSNVVPLLPEEDVDLDTFELDDIEDDLLRLMFTCCHPVLPTSAQITLMLKVVLGFSVDEIARALLASRSSIEKRITRAKHRLQHAQVEYAVPTAAELPDRLHAVLQAIYLLFNEGYSRIQDSNVSQNSLLEEAIRLGRMVSRAFREHPDPRSLLALMLLSAARLPTRVSREGVFVPLEEQDRKLWDQAMIGEGLALIDAVYAARHPPSGYQIQAAISAIHSTAPDADDVDWEQIAGLYEKLQDYDRSPVVPVNRAVAVCCAGRPLQALEILDSLSDERLLADYQPYFAALAFVHERLRALEEAKAAYSRAIELASSAPQRAYLEGKVKSLE